MYHRIFVLLGCACAIACFSLSGAYAAASANLVGTTLRIQLSANGDQGFLDRNAEGAYVVEGTGLAPTVFPAALVGSIQVEGSNGIQSFAVRSGPVTVPLTTDAQITSVSLANQGGGPAVLTNGALDIGGLVSIQANVVAGTHTYRGGVLLQNNPKVQSETGGLIDFQKPINPGGDQESGVEITTPGTVRLRDNVGAFLRLTFLSINAGLIELGSDQIANIEVKVDDVLVFNGPVLLSASAQFMAPGGIEFTSRVDGPFNLTLTPEGGVAQLIFGGPVGSIQPLASLWAVDWSGVTALPGASIELDGSLPGATPIGLVLAGNQDVNLTQPGSRIAGFSAIGLAVAPGGMPNSQIANFLIENNQDGMVFFGGDYSATTVYQNVIQTNLQGGITLTPGPGQGLTGLSIRRLADEESANLIRSNGRDGILVLSGDYLDTIIFGNRIDDNGRDGIRLEASVTGLMVRSNRVEENLGAGLRINGQRVNGNLGSFAGTVVRQNTFRSNTGDDIIMGSATGLSLGGGFSNLADGGFVTLAGTVELVDQLRIRGAPTLYTEIRGTDPGEFGSIKASSVQLSDFRALRATLSGFFPQADDFFQILNSDDIEGITEYELPNLFGLGWGVQSFPSNGVLVVSLPISPVVDSPPIEGRIGFDQPFAAGIDVVFGTYPIYFSDEDQQLPFGLSLSSNGELTGNPASTGRYQGTIRVYNNGGSELVPFDLTVEIDPSLLAGNFSGVALDADQEDYVRAGLRIRVGRGGAYSYRLELGPAMPGQTSTVFSGRGRLDETGTIDGVWTAGGRNPLQLGADLRYVREGTWSGFWGAISDEPELRLQALANAAAFDARHNPLPDPIPGLLTMQILPEWLEIPQNQPDLIKGRGFAAGRLRSDGTLRMAGQLANGARFSLSSTAGGDLTEEFLELYFPAFHLLQGGRGFVGGILGAVFEDDNLQWLGEMNWLAPPSRTFPEGLLAGGLPLPSLYARPARGQPALIWPLDIGDLVLEGGELAEAIEARVGIDGRNRFRVFGDNPNDIDLRIAPGNGRVRGSFFHPALGRRVSFTGVANQEDGTIEGFFLGSQSSGALRIEPMLPDF